MINQSQNNKRIAQNTLLLYFRMIIMMIVSIYTSRVNLQVLGIEDYGIYNVVGGFVTMFLMISASLNNAINRFFTFEIGKGDIKSLARTFSASVTIQLMLACIVLLIAETIGLWFVNCKMVIPEERLFAANFVYQFSIISFIISLITVPYNAAIIAHERMSAFAYMSIFDVFGKLVIAWSTLYAPIDKLIFFAGIIMIFSLIMRFIYGIYCKHHFKECRYDFVLDKEMLRNMFGFAGWNLIGSASAILRDQGGNIIINLFFGPVVNAARAIAVQVNNAVAGFVNNFQTALTPQITKNYASGNYEYMFTLTLQGSRLSFYILYFISLPIILNTGYILELWLGEVPAHTPLFVQLILVLAMCDCLANPFSTIALATGNIRNYQLVIGGLQMLNFPIAYVCLKLGCIPESVTIVAIIIASICMFFRLLILRKMVKLSIRRVLKDVYWNVIVVGGLSPIIPCYVAKETGNDFLSFLLICIVCVISTTFVMVAIGCNKTERAFLRRKLYNIIGKQILL